MFNNFLSLSNWFINTVYSILISLFPFLKDVDTSGIWELYGFKDDK